MKLTREEVGAVVRRVLTYYIRKKESCKDQDRFLFLIPAYSIGLEEVLSEYDLYGETASMDILTEEKEGDSTFSSFFLNQPFAEEVTVRSTGKRKDVQYIFQNLSGYRKVEVQSPSLELLRAVREGREENLLARIILNALLMGKPVIVREPYSMDELPPGKFSREMREMQSDLWDMGVAFADLHVSLGDSGIATRNDAALITEQDVEQLARNGQRELVVRREAVVTPLALDRAREWNVHIIKQ